MAAAKTSSKAGKKNAVPPAAPASPAPGALDVARLLAPIAGDSRSGESLRYEGTYDAIRNARQADDPSLPRGVWESTPKKADWEQVARLCQSALAERSKDLQIAVWLSEAAFMRHGLAGLVDGLAVIDGLLTDYWEDMHPAMPEDEPEYRAAPLEWLSEHLALRLRLMPLNVVSRDGATAFCLDDWQRRSGGARDQGAGDEEDRDDGGEAQQRRYRDRNEMLTATLRDPAEHYRELALDADRAAQALGSLDRIIDSRFRPADAPSLHELREALAGMRQVAERALDRAGAGHLLTAQGVAGDSAAASDVAAPAAAAPPGDSRAAPAGKADSMSSSREKAASAPAVGAGPIGSRNEAYRLLEAAADWLMANEPHSPTPYLIKRAVSWRDKSLVELMSDETNRTFLMSVYDTADAGGGRRGGEDED